MYSNWGKRDFWNSKTRFNMSSSFAVRILQLYKKYPMIHFQMERIRAFEQCKEIGSVIAKPLLVKPMAGLMQDVYWILLVKTRKKLTWNNDSKLSLELEALVKAQGCWQVTESKWSSPLVAINYIISVGLLAVRRLVKKNDNGVWKVPGESSSFDCHRNNPYYKYFLKNLDLALNIRSINSSS